MTLAPTTAISRIAAQAYAARQAAARAQLAARQLDHAAAQHLLRPWAAIACLAGAELPELADPLADRVTRDLDGTPACTEGEARALLALDICPRSRWSAVLAKARDRALDRAEASALSPRMPAPERAADLTAARELRSLAEALGVTQPYLPKAQKELA